MRWVVNRLDITQRVRQSSWSGSKAQCAREAELSVAISETDPNFPPLDLPLFAPVQGYDEVGKLRFLGQVVQRRRSSGGSALDLYAMDRGYQLANNDGWYSFRDSTPEEAVAVLAADHGIKLGEVAAGRGRVSRKFPGVALHKIIDTMYTLAATGTGRKYQIRFDGEALTVKEIPDTPRAVLAPRVNVMSSDIAEDASDYRNSVAIYSETGSLLRTLDRREDQTLAGLLQAAVTQRDGEDASREAQELLDEGEIQQSVTVECLGNYDLVTGEAVMVRETSAGVAGLFWIDEDTHTWKNGQHFCRLTLNFKKLMNDTEAGEEL